MYAHDTHFFSQNGNVQISAQVGPALAFSVGYLLSRWLVVLAPWLLSVAGNSPRY